MEQSPAWETDRRSTRLKIPHLSWNRRLITCSQKHIIRSSPGPVVSIPKPSLPIPLRYCHVWNDYRRGLDWQLNLLDLIQLHSVTVYTLYNTTALQTTLTEYHGRVFTRQGLGPPSDPTLLSLTLTGHQLTLLFSSIRMTAESLLWSDCFSAEYSLA
jgi:hypothetical protein